MTESATMTEVLAVFANVVVVVILPVTLMLVRHITGLRKDLLEEIHRIAKRIEAAEKQQLHFQAEVSKTYITESAADRLISQQSAITETKLNGVVKGMERIESWLNRVTETARRKDD